MTETVHADEKAVYSDYSVPPEPHGRFHGKLVVDEIAARLAREALAAQDSVHG